MTPSADELLLIGEIVAPFGLRGQVKLRCVTDRPDHIERRVRTIYVGAAHIPYTIRNVFEHKPRLLILTLKDVTTREAAEDLRGAEVAIVETDAAPLAEDEYFLHQLYNLRVETVEGLEIGHVHEVLETGSNEVLVVTRPDENDVLIPMIRDVVAELNLAEGRVIIRPLDGLL